MYTKPTTLTEFILAEEHKQNKATGSFTLLLTHIENAAKIIASHIKKTGLVDIIGEVGQKNASQDEVKKIDEFSNNLLMETLASSKQVYRAASEEMDNFLDMDKNGKYVVFFDPLDGSSNIESAVTVGTIFSIYHKGDVLEAGSKQVAAGYILYGTSVMFVYTFGNGVNGFTLDPSIGSFLLSNPDIKIPKTGKTYSVNESTSLLWDKKLQEYITFCKKEGYNMRYIGSMVADIHRTLFKGGIFLYPSNTKTPQGKVRLMYEVNPLSFVIEQAGGRAVSSGVSPLTIVPTELHQRVPIVLGSADEVSKFREICG